MGKRTILLILALLPCLPIFKINAALPPHEVGKPIDIEYDQPTQPRSIKPECYYLDGYIYIIGDVSVTSISGTVTRISDNLQWSNNSTSNVLQIAVSSDTGSYHLIFTLSDGTSYYGDYTLD